MIIGIVFLGKVTVIVYLIVFKILLLVLELLTLVVYTRV